VKTLHSQLADRERLIENHRDVVNGLQEQLNACKVRIANEKAQKAAAHEEASGLKERNAELETKVSALQNKISPAENAQLQLNEAKADLEKTKRAFDSAKTDLESKAGALGALTVANTSLGDQVKALHNRLQDTQKAKDQSEPQQEEQIARRVREAEQRTRKEMADHIESFETQLKTKASNEVKRLTSERNRLEKQIKPLQEELASSKRLTTQMQRDKSAASDALKQELERTKKHSQSLQNEIEALQSSFNDLKASSMANKGDQEKLSNLSAQLNAEKTKLKQTTEQNAELLQQLKRLGKAKEKMELAKEQAQADLADLHKENDGQVDVLQKELDEAKDTAERAAAGLEHYKESCRKFIDDASENADRKVQALQKRLSEAQAELKREKEEGEKFRNAVEENWLQEQQTFKEDLEASNKKVSEAEARTSEAEASAERRLRQEFQTTMDEQRASLASLHEQLEQERKQSEEAEEKLQSQQRPSSKDSKTSSFIKVPNTNDGITPITSIKSTASPKVRKKADRNKNATTEVGVVPVPEEIRPVSRKTNSATDRTATKGPVVEESQFVSDAFAIKHAGPATLDRARGSFSTVPDNDTLHLQSGSSQALPHTVPETQFEDTLPSFAAVHRSLSSTQAAPSLPPSTSFSACAKYELNGIAGNERIVSNDFTVYDDGHGREQSSQLQYPRAEGYRRASESWSQEEKDKYTYQKPVPQPNSASKRVHSYDRHSNHAGRNNPGSQQRAEPGKDRYKTPNPDTGVSDDPGNRVQSSSASTSSPAFMQAKHSNRRQSTYGASGGKCRTSQPNAGYIADPRLAGRNEQGGPKRKADNDIVEGYERERKKRLGVTANSLGRDERPDRSQQPQSINDLPGMKAGQKSSQTRMQHLAGGSSRPTRPAKTMTKSMFSHPNRHASS
jgi:predicted  nucleic acid-binding Zn-ribbon protein